MMHAMPWYAKIYNFLVASTYPQRAFKAYKDKLGSEAKLYIWDDPYLWRICSDQVYSRVQDQVGPPLLSYDSRSRPLRINEDSLKGPRLWAILAHHILTRTHLCLDLRSVQESQDGHKPMK
ncbi:hypothetical protein CR513_53972, partial [Mucuna pruriens]